MSDLLSQKKEELEHLRKEKIQAQVVRSRIQWLHEGEKPSRYFCNLEKRNYIDKVIKKLKLPNGDTISEQHSILDHVSQFYKSLFSNKDEILDTDDFDQIFNGIKSEKLTDEQSKNLNGYLTTEEIGIALKKMQNNKTPGIDGFPAEFFNFF